MKIKELIEQLKKFDENLEIVTCAQSFGEWYTKPDNARLAYFLEDDGDIEYSGEEDDPKEEIGENAKKFVCIE